MLLHNMGLIHSVAQRLGGQGLEYDDLVASGIPGLVRAIEKFDPYRGLKFSTYAMHWVRQSVTRAIDNEGRIVRLPVHVIESIRQVKAAQERLTVDGKMPRGPRSRRRATCRSTGSRSSSCWHPRWCRSTSPWAMTGSRSDDLVDRPIRREPVEVQGMDGDDLQPLLDCLVEREADILRRRHGLPPYDDAATLDESARSMA